MDRAVMWSQEASLVIAGHILWVLTHDRHLDRQVGGRGHGGREEVLSRAWECSETGLGAYVPPFRWAHKGCQSEWPPLPSPEEAPGQPLHRVMKKLIGESESFCQEQATWSSPPLWVEGVVPASHSHGGFSEMRKGGSSWCRLMVSTGGRHL